MDNLLLQSNGKLFHIDFGFILGEDPKSWPPPMKITREMVLAMGGETSEHYYKFRNLICESFILLRRRSQIVITLFDLMLQAKITNGHKVREREKKKEGFNVHLIRSQRCFMIETICSRFRTSTVWETLRRGL